MIGFFNTTSPDDAITNEDARRMLESAGCPVCESDATYLTEADVDGETARVVICDDCGHAIVADR